MLGVYVGKLKPTVRQKAIARRICEKVDPRQVADVMSSLRPRHFQSAAFFLSFLHQSAPRKYQAVVRLLDWEKLDSTIGNDWANMPHDIEILLGALYSSPSTRHLVQEFISKKADRIEQFPPRLLLMAPEVGFAHIAKGGSLDLGSNHVDWELGGLAVAIISEVRPELTEQTVSPYADVIARCVTKYNRDLTGPAEGFVRVMIEHAPITWKKVLARIDPKLAEDGLAECLRLDADHRRTAAAVIESAVTWMIPLGKWLAASENGSQRHQSCRTKYLVSRRGAGGRDAGERNSQQSHHILSAIARSSGPTALP